MTKRKRLAMEHKPKLSSVEPPLIPDYSDWKRLRQICDKSGALMMADMLTTRPDCRWDLSSPVPYADFVTTTTHKTLRGPRGGIVMCKAQYAQTLDKIVSRHPSGPLMHVIAGKAVALGEALKPAFKKYQTQVMKMLKLLPRH